MPRPVIVEHCYGSPATGGPASALYRLQQMRDAPNPEIWQHHAAGGISPALLWRFVRDLRRLRPDLLHVRGLGNEGFHAALAGRLAGVPRILVTVHGTQRDLVGRNTLRRRIVVQLLERATLLMADAVVTVCESAARRDFLDPVRHKLLPPVVNGTRIVPHDRATRRAVRDRLGIPEDRVTAAVVSRLTLQKGYGDLAAALKRLEADATAQPLDLIVVGNGDEAPAIRAQFAGLKRCRVHFAGQQEDVSPFLLAADLFVFPSWHENLSNALIEAMAHGLPVVATEVGGNVEVLERGGGLLVPAHDPPALARALARLAGDGDARDAMGQAARRVIADGFTVEHMLQTWNDRYASVLGRGGPAFGA